MLLQRQLLLPWTALQAGQAAADAAPAAPHCGFLALSAALTTEAPSSCQPTMHSASQSRSNLSHLMIWK
jgi:hypothetical protein